MSLDEEISRLQDRLGWLQGDRIELSTRLRRHEAILSPVRWAPSEILGEIFMWTLPSTFEEALDGCNFDLKRIPWVLTHVCSHWRAVASSMPSLWSLILLCYDQGVRYPLAAVQTQVERSRLLRVHFYGARDFASEEQVQMFQYLNEHSARWEELSIVLTSDLLPLLGGLRGRIPSLERLCLDWDDEEDEQAATSIDEFQTAVSLVELHLCRLRLPITFSLPRSQLTHYNIAAPWNSHRQLLSMLPSIVQARIVVIGYQTDWSISDQLLELTHLRRVYTSHMNALAFLKVSTLEQITFDRQGLVGRASLPPSLNRFLTESSATVRRIGVACIPDPRLATQILQRYPSVTELAILIDEYQTHQSEATNDLLAILPISESGPSLAPQLTHFHLASETDLQIDYDLILHILESRWESPRCTLRAATLVFNDRGATPNPEVQDRLDVLQTRGLEFSVLEQVAVHDHVVGWFCKPTWC
ncbi:hypothetical protein FB45DRAFT_947200 [Roridomyces roridus]|uniref:F-box domain-containing protein n=1 Tax=Roridomyces roridus TaxID=1738132 RepID=A0AAD7FAV6_9AGAR|nr:hypothetical protein FB45DRAFT_947200 [Roridomyces roridus]